MKRRTIASITNETRTSCWTLIQNEDGTLEVEQEADYPDGAHRKRVVPINEFMLEGGPPPRVLQALIDRMFDD